ncbi:MAG: four helix bundle protein [Candidatus Staskawiczbacteria bacterium RIFCSPLOWO2_01_FULL_38_12b]|uniref:Four helix bundle protein n=1 Tax=Candidatus Staskawiczbacteria bacterium RIFCSPLOWO2_01_FULL_38_12b TaxID=1802214 RepID=A0A1G2ICL3_9BACT|nr:MAG: four helix bundle protein [Candidatus Staskawiczbacteria bacterium RIFCSPLOWO2_01_FULL_38_12b]
MTNIKDKKFDLEDRTAKFGENIIDFSKKIKSTPITMSLISQLVRSATSIGANYCEADCAETKKDFEHKIGICKKESKESRHWVRMVARAIPELSHEARIYWKEANELNLIFSAIVRKSREKNLSI